MPLIADDQPERFSLSDFLRRFGRERGGMVALREGGRSVGFGTLDENADRVATGLRSAGVKPGDRLLVVLDNAIETFELMIGCARAGVVLVPVNWRLSIDELLAVARDSGASAVVCGQRFAHLITPLRDLGIGDALRLVAGEASGEAGYYGEWLRAQSPGPVASGETDAVLQIYTSGTSGLPKGVLITEANLAAKVPRVARIWGFDSSSVSLLATPLFHIGALSWGIVGLYAGATTILAESASADTLLRHLQVDAVTHTFLVPTMIRRLIEAVPPGTGFPALRAIAYGAAPISAELQRRAAGVFSCRLHQIYGLTETTGGITQLDVEAPVHEEDQALTSVGRPYPWVELEIRDPSSRMPVAIGVPGEVWTRSEQNTTGYARLQEETSALFGDDGWLRTGDGGYLDTDGRLYLTDRIKDMIVSGGENVYPAEVENVLSRHPDVAEVAVVGVPDDQWGETVVAVVVPAAGAVATPAELETFAAERIAAYKRPRRVVMVDELPRNAAGKVLKRVLREKLSERLGR